MNSITAQEAHQLSTEKYEELLELNTKFQLNEIYRIVRIQVKEGAFEAVSPLKYWGNKFKKGLTQILESQGYSVEYKNTSLGEFIVVKWGNHQ